MNRVYIVRRGSPESDMEIDVFTDHQLAKQWAEYCDSEVEEEGVLDAEDIRMMKRAKHAGVECAECGDSIDSEDDGQSTYCGSIHGSCFNDHSLKCEACKEG